MLEVKCTGMVDAGCWLSGFTMDVSESGLAGSRRESPGGYYSWKVPKVQVHASTCSPLSAHCPVAFSMQLPQS
jgi:hypothetical protein